MGTVQLPGEVARDPGGVVDSILTDIGIRLVTLGQFAAHPIDGFTAVADSIAVLRPNASLQQE